MKKILLAVVAVLSIVLLAGCGGSNKTLHCYSEQTTNGVVTSSTIDVKFNGNTAEKIDVAISITVPDSFASYIDTFKSTLETQRTKLENTGYTVNIETKGNVVSLKATGTDKTLSAEEKTGSYEATKKAYENQGLTCK